MSLKGKTLFITGASRGIGYAIGLKAARDGANIVIAAKSESDNPKLPGTIHSAAKDMIAAGGQALAVACDIRDEAQVKAAIDKAIETFGGIDILVNNASAINLKGTLDTEMKRFDLMHQVNARGTFLCAKLALPHLKKAANPHILTLSPPLNIKAHWFGPYLAYTMAKYGMSMCTLGLAAEFKQDGVAVNSLWPETTIDTAAVRNLLGGEAMANASRTTDIVADAAYVILNRNSRECSGNFFLDVEVLKSEGITDFSKYAVSPGHKLQRDLFLDDWFEGIAPEDRNPPSIAAATAGGETAKEDADGPAGTNSDAQQPQEEPDSGAAESSAEVSGAAEKVVEAASDTAKPEHSGEE
ncbi:MAG TPA: NAD(P)-dependent oxidoreductase [Candidatus Obscuribacterales bacterium]